MSFSNISIFSFLLFLLTSNDALANYRYELEIIFTNEQTKTVYSTGGSLHSEIISGKLIPEDKYPFFMGVDSNSVYVYENHIKYITPREYQSICTDILTDLLILDKTQIEQIRIKSSSYQHNETTGICSYHTSSDSIWMKQPVCEIITYENLAFKFILFKHEESYLLNDLINNILKSSDQLRISNNDAEKLKLHNEIFMLNEKICEYNVVIIESSTI